MAFNIGSLIVLAVVLLGKTSALRVFEVNGKDAGEDRIPFGQLIANALRQVPNTSNITQQLPRLGPSIKYRYIEHPNVLRLADMQAKHIDTTGMVKLPLKVTNGAQVAIFGFPDAEDQFVSGSIRATGRWEGDIIDQLCGHFTSTGKGNFLDVGSNIGAYSLSLSTCVGSQGTVFAVEGMPLIANHVMAGVSANNMTNVAVIPYAVSNTASGNNFTMGLNPNNKGGSTKIGNKDWSNAGDATVITVDVTTLDSVLANETGMRNILAMKMDIEGSEGLALGGARELLAKYAPCHVVIELCQDWLQKAGTPMDGVISVLEGAGYDTTSVPRPFPPIGTFSLQQKKLQECVDRLYSGTQKILNHTS